MKEYFECCPQIPIPTCKFESEKSAEGLKYITFFEAESGFCFTFKFQVINKSKCLGKHTPHRRPFCNVKMKVRHGFSKHPFPTDLGAGGGGGINPALF